MNINIRSHIIDNFKNSTVDELKSSINSALTDKEELALPGLGVFFELLFENCDDVTKQSMLNTLHNALK